MDDTPGGSERQDAEGLTATLAAIIYASPDSPFIVARFDVEGELFPIVATGEMFSPTVGEAYSLEGAWVHHPKYGKQFRFTSYEVSYPITSAGIERYLGSGLIRGIREGIARRIVKRFGTETITILNTDIDRLREVDGIGEKTLAVIRDAWERQRGIQSVMLALKEFGISTGYAVAISRVYGSDAVRIVRGTPYRLIEDVEGIGFVVADRIARQIGIDPNDEGRLRAGLLYVMREAARADGHSCLPRDDCIAAAARVLGSDEHSVAAAVSASTRDRLLIDEEDRVYLPELYHAETAIAMQCARLHDHPPVRVDHLTLDDSIRLVERRLGLSFSPVQVEAIHKSLAEPLTILTGGPGTGKTTAMAGLIAVAQASGLRTALCAPTGRAARRLAAVCQHTASTIHRLLEFDPAAWVFQRNADAPVEADIIVVDEVSMIDVELMARLLLAVPDGGRLVLVGDPDQLPSVGPGNVLADLLGSGRVATVALHVIYRQDEHSRIVTNAHRVREGFLPVFERDTFLLETDHADAIARTIRDVVVHRIPREMGYNAVTDIQVLSPMHNTASGVRHLNDMLRRELNADGRTIFHKGDRIWSIGDKVMQTRNNYDKDVFNGDIGFIQDVDEDEATVDIAFDDRIVSYAYEELDELTHAYAITIHKSQGSEYPVVVVPLSMQHRIMLQRNLLYTAMTRAKSLLVFVGQRAALSAAVMNARPSRRYSTLLDRVRTALR